MSSFSSQLGNTNGVQNIRQQFFNNQSGLTSRTNNIWKQMEKFNNLRKNSKFNSTSEKIGDITQIKQQNGFLPQIFETRQNNNTNLNDLLAQTGFSKFGNFNKTKFPSANWLNNGNLGNYWQNSRGKNLRQFNNTNLNDFLAQKGLNKFVNVNSTQFSSENWSNNSNLGNYWRNSKNNNYVNSNIIDSTNMPEALVSNQSRNIEQILNDGNLYKPGITRENQTDLEFIQKIENNQTISQSSQRMDQIKTNNQTFGKINKEPQQIHTSHCNKTQEHVIKTDTKPNITIPTKLNDSNPKSGNNNINLEKSVKKITKRSLLKRLKRQILTTAITYPPVLPVLTWPQTTSGPLTVLTNLLDGTNMNVPFLDLGFAPNGYYSTTGPPFAGLNSILKNPFALATNMFMNPTGTMVDIFILLFTDLYNLIFRNTLG